MNVYDTVNKLATEIKQSEEYVNYKMAKEVLDLNSDLKNKIKEFEQIRYEVQIDMMQTGKINEEKNKKMQDLYIELIQNPDAKRYIEVQTNFNIMISDVNKIIGDAIKDVL